MNEIKQSALEKLIKLNFCNLESVKGCTYSKEEWCPKSYGYYKNKDKLMEIYRK